MGQTVTTYVCDGTCMARHVIRDEFRTSLCVGVWDWSGRDKYYYL
jgi:hypothetical protein